MNQPESIEGADETSPQAKPVRQSISLDPNIKKKLEEYCARDNISVAKQGGLIIAEWLTKNELPSAGTKLNQSESSYESSSDDETRSVNQNESRPKEWLKLQNKYISSLESQVETLTTETNKKNQLIDSLTDGNLIVKPKSNIPWYRRLLPFGIG